MKWRREFESMRVTPVANGYVVTIDLDPHQDPLKQRDRSSNTFAFDSFGRLVDWMRMRLGEPASEPPESMPAPPPDPVLRSRLTGF